MQIRVNLLQKQLDDGLTEPILISCGVASMQNKACGNIINDFIQYCHRQLNIAFKGLQFEINDEVVNFGLHYPKTQDAFAIVEVLKQNSKAIEKYLEIWKLVHVEYIAKYDVISVSYRVTPPKPPGDEGIYKDGLIPASQFTDQIYIATDHSKKGKPTLRVMSSTGGGKGIAVKNILAYFTTLEGWELWLSDPLDGSEEDYWNCAKIAKTPKEATEAYKKFTELHRVRQQKQPTFTDKFVLAIFDEFDRQHSDADKETAKTIMTAIRHTKQRQILIGQSGEVGENNWTWDAMKNCALLFIEDAVTTAIKHDKDLGWSLTKKREVQKKYEKFSEWARLKNESGNIPNENAYRIALLVVGDNYKFLEIPSAHQGIIRSGAGIVRDSFDVISSNSGVINSNIPEIESIKTPIFEIKVVCPHCESTSFKRNGKTKTSTPVQKYKCKHCNKEYNDNDLIN